MRSRLRGTGPSSVASLLLLALVASACRTAQPYPEPGGPLYTGSFADEAAAGRRAAAGGPLRLRIVTFNVEYALRVDRALAALRSNPALREADILALQEMDAPGTEAIARGLGLNYVYCPASVHPKIHRDVGDAILSPWPLTRPVKLLLPHRSRVLGQSRVAVGADVTVAGRRLRVYSLHLGSPLGNSGDQRRHQIDVVLADAQKSPGPVVIAGDFNSKGLGQRLLAWGYSWPTREVGASTHGFSFDHVFLRGLRIGEARAGVAREVTDASDHRPVWVEVVAAPD